MKVLVLGSCGMAGHVIVDQLADKHDVETVARKYSDYKLDIEDVGAVEDFFKSHNNYDFVINAIGLLVKNSEDRMDRAIMINSWFPQFLANQFNGTRTRLIHISTDCLFDGSTGYYREESQPTAYNNYGRSKALGEVKNNKDITFRTSIIGPELKEDGTGLLEWLIKNQSNIIPGWINHWWNGITTLELAKAIDYYIDNSSITGLYHLVNNDYRVNKYELLCKINEIFLLNKNITPTTSEVPCNRILVNNRVDFGYKVQPLDTQLEELKDFMVGHYS